MTASMITMTVMSMVIRVAMPPTIMRAPSDKR